MKCKRAAVLLLDCISFGSLGKLADADKEDFAFPGGYASLPAPLKNVWIRGEDARKIQRRLDTSSLPNITFHLIVYIRKYELSRISSIGEQLART